ncbi:MAG: hypothetical protein Q7R35_04345 [Elusimicrobiota bacterium]|nr:hypothetical protein [Elusimicrobiota bacterium]
MPEEHALNRPEKPQIGTNPPDDKPKHTPKEILERMKAAQAELEQREAERARNLLEREKECQAKIAALQENQKETEQTLDLAKREIAGKKDISEEYTAGIRELEQIIVQIKQAIQAVHVEITQIQNDPGVAEKKLRERKEQDRKAEQAFIEAEAKKLADQVKEHEQSLQKLAQNMIAFLVKDAGWAFSLDQLHQFKCAAKGGKVGAEIAEIEKKIPPLEEERDAVSSKLEEKSQGLLKFGTKELEDRLVAINAELAALQAQVAALTAKVNEKISKFDGVEKPLRAEMRVFTAFIKQLKDATKKEPEGIKIVPVKESDVNEASDGHLRNYSIYKDFLKQFGYDGSAPASFGGAPPPPPVA